VGPKAVAWLKQELDGWTDRWTERHKNMYKAFFYLCNNYKYG